MNKYPLDAFGGLLVTGAAGYSSVFADRLADAVLDMLQLTGTSVAVCSDLHAEVVSQASSSPHAPPCLIPLATRINILTSVALPQDMGAIREVLETHRGVLEPWEARHLEATLAFGEFDFVRCGELCAEALALEPRDAFTARLLFISTFNCGHSHTLLAGFSAAIAEIYKRGIGGSPSYCQPSCAGPCGDDKVPPSFAPLPYYLALLGFAMNESGVGGTAGALHHALGALECVKRYNACRYRGRDGWIHPFAVHTVCHLMAPTPLEGLTYIDTIIPKALWEPSAYFAVHLYYHIIAMLLDCGKVEEASDMYDTCLWPRVAHEDMYSVSDATGVLGRLQMGDYLRHGDPRPAKLVAQWRLAASAHIPAISRVPFFVMNLTATAALFGASTSEDGAALQLLADAVVEGSAQPFKTIFGAVMGGDAAGMASTRRLWRSIGGSKGQIDIMERLRVHFVGLADPMAAAREMRASALLYPYSVYYPAQSQRYERMIRAAQE